MKTEAVLGHTKPKPGKAQGCRQPPEASLERILPPEGTHPASTLTPGLWPPGLQQSNCWRCVGRAARNSHTWAARLCPSGCFCPHAGLFQASSPTTPVNPLQPLCPCPSQAESPQHCPPDPRTHWHPQSCGLSLVLPEENPLRSANEGSMGPGWGGVWEPRFPLWM